VAAVEATAIGWTHAEQSVRAVRGFVLADARACPCALMSGYDSSRFFPSRYRRFAASDFDGSEEEPCILLRIFLGRFER
jgi:hypothetical protein